MTNILTVTTPRSTSANQDPAYGGCLPKIAAMESSALPYQHIGQDIPVGLITGIAAIPLSLMTSIVMSVKVGLATMAVAYLIGWAVARSKRTR